MSHFVVLVAGDVEAQMEPYAEDLEVEPYVSDTHDDVLLQFNSRLVKVKEENLVDEFSTLTLNTDPTKLDQLRIWWKEWCGKELDDDGNSLSTYNPDSKWDFWSVGGRWPGKIRLIPGRGCNKGTPSYAFKHAKEDPYGDDPLNVDSANMCDIDWKYMDKQQYDYAIEYWDELMFSPLEEHQYRTEWVMSERKRLLDKYKTKENYAKKVGKFGTYAILTPYHGWVAPGDMLMFGMSSETEGETEKFKSKTYSKILRELQKKDPDILISIVDCHI